MNLIRRALVTGKKGFIGRFLTKRLLQEGWELSNWEGDIQDLASHREPVNVVFHLAGVTRHDQFLEAHPHGYEVNVLGTLSVMHYCRRIGARCLFASSSSLYQSSRGNQPLSEQAPLEPVSDYSISKWLAEKVCEQFSREDGVPTTILRIFNPYGPGQHPSFLIPQAISSLIENKPLFLRMPHAIRDFVYMDDLVQAFLQVATHPAARFQIFNVGSGQGIKILDVMHCLEQTFGKPVRLETGTAHPGESAASVSDISKIRKETGWQPQFDLKSGLKAIKKQMETL